MEILRRRGLKLSGYLFWLALIVVWAAVTGTVVAQPSGDDIAAQFPDPAQVTADYPDEAQRYVALNTLWDWMHEKAPVGAGAVAKRGAYYNAAESIHARHLTSADATAFQSRIEQLTADRAFKRSVLEKYGLIDLAAASGNPMRSGDVTDAMIKGAVWAALPYFIATLVVMFLLVKIMVRNSVRSRTFASPAPFAAPGWPQLPEALRTIKVPGLRYPVEFMAGLVVDKETVVHTRHTTTTTPAQTYTVGNDVYFTPGQTRTTSLSTNVETIWLRTSDRGETFWTLTGTNFKSRPGQVISAIGRRTSPTEVEFILAYNHATGQLEALSYAVHAARMRWAFLAAALVGSVGFAICIGIVLSIHPEEDPLNRQLLPLVVWLEGLIPAVFLAIMIALKASGAIFKSRTARFKSQYLPEFQQFLGQATPQLQRYFGAA